MELQLLLRKRQMALEGSEKGSDMVSSISTKNSYCSLRLGWENWVELDGRMLYKVRDRGWDPWGSSGGDMEWENLGILCREEYGTCWWASRGCKIVELGHIYGARNRVPVNWSGKICRSWFGGSVSFGYKRFEVFVYLFGGHSQWYSGFNAEASPLELCERPCAVLQI